MKLHLKLEKPVLSIIDIVNSRTSDCTSGNVLEVLFPKKSSVVFLNIFSTFCTNPVYASSVCA